ncbi:hypothetical protein WP50_33615 [Lactiplantibacillus plantarum]|nr:hypothetical protein WP50_33615 [Lactiplantibacillus plantarum]
MHYGKILEIGPADEVYNHPLHKYTESLISALPVLDPPLERNSKQVAYYETTEHDGKKRRMVEIAPGHFVRATEDERTTLVVIHMNFQVVNVNGSGLPGR